MGCGISKFDVDEEDDAGRFHRARRRRHDRDTLSSKKLLYDGQGENTGLNPESCKGKHEPVNGEVLCRGSPSFREYCIDRTSSLSSEEKEADNSNSEGKSQSIKSFSAMNFKDDIKSSQSELRGTRRRGRGFKMGLTRGRPLVVKSFLNSSTLYNTRNPDSSGQRGASVVG